MISIVNRFEKLDEEKIDSLDDINHVELFYKAYSQMDNLTLRELRVLRNFCYTLYDPYNLTIIKNGLQTESTDEVYYKYSNVLNNYIIEKKVKRKTISRF